MSSQTDDELGRLIETGIEAVIENEANDSGHNAHPRSYADELEAFKNETRFLRTRSIIWGALIVLFVVALALVFAFQGTLTDWSWSGTLPKNPAMAADRILSISPVIDGHIDLPILARSRYANNVSAIDLESPMPGHVDIPRLREGKVGGFFWSVYVECPAPSDGGDFISPTWLARDTLEQIDVARLLIDKYPNTFTLARSSNDIRTAIAQGKIASLLGVEGAHQLGNSIAVLRQYHALGVRYVTLTHVCHNAFADSCGMAKPLHGGISQFGRSLIDEMNRLGILVDLSHTSDATAAQALNHSKAPVIWSHSSARAVHDVPRNVPDDILTLIGTGEGQKDAVVMVNFAPYFVARPGKANVRAVADHIEHIANIAGKQHVGIGSDFDGIGEAPRGLEDVSKYPALIAELYRRGWDKFELSGLAGANLLRVYEGAESISRELRSSGTPAVYDLYDKRPDLPTERPKDEM